ATLRGQRRLTLGRLAHDGPGPGAVVGPRERLLTAGDALEVDDLPGLAGELSRPPRLGPQRDLAHGAVEKRAEPPGPIGPRPREQAAVPEAFEEDVLNGVVQLLEQLRTPPPHGQVGPYRGRVPGREFRPRRLAPRGGVPEQGPAGGIPGPHARSPPHSPLP